MEEKYCCNQTLMIFLLGGGEMMNTREDKRIIKLKIFKIALFEHILKKINTFTFGAWSHLLLHIRFTLVKVPKTL